MSAVQSTVNVFYAFGVPGEFYFDGPQRAGVYNIESDSAAYNIIGATAFTTADGVDAKAGGVIGNGRVFAGILAQPKVYATSGTTAGALAPTLTLPNHGTGEFATMGYLVVTLPAAAALGDLVLMDTTTGALSTVSPNFAATGAASGSATLTVSLLTTGSIGIGSKVFGTDADGVEVIALGSGTGGNGTYTLNKSVTVAGLITGTSKPATGKAFVPNAVVDRPPPTTSGVAGIRLTN